MLTCRDATRLLSDRLDNDLPLGTRISLRFHVMMCRHCARYARQINFIHATLGDHAEQLAEVQARQAPPLPDARRERIEAALSKELSQP